MYNKGIHNSPNHFTSLVWLFQSCTDIIFKILYIEIIIKANIYIYICVWYMQNQTRIYISNYKHVQPWTSNFQAIRDLAPLITTTCKHFQTQKLKPREFTQNDDLIYYLCTAFWIFNRVLLPAPVGVATFLIKYFINFL